MLRKIIGGVNFSIPAEKLNKTLKKTIKPIIKQADLENFEQIDFYTKFFDPCDNFFDFILGSNTTHEKLEFGLKYEKVQSILNSQNTNKVILYFHGGGFVSFSPRTHRPISAYLSRYTGMTVYVPDYTKTYKERFPTQIDECVELYKKLISDGYNVILSGDSAGGNLALTVTLKLMSLGITPPIGVVCFSPWGDLGNSGNTIRTHEHLDDIIPVEKMFEAADMYADNKKDPLVSPIYANYKYFPKTQIHVGSQEVLLDDSLKIWAKMVKQRVDCNIKVWRNGTHTFPVWAKLSKKSRECLKMAAEFMTEL